MEAIGDGNDADMEMHKPNVSQRRSRLCAQASLEPTALGGLAKLDSPTVQRIGVMILLQLVLNLGWTKNWIKCDISSAFLQG